MVLHNEKGDGQGDNLWIKEQDPWGKKQVREDGECHFGIRKLRVFLPMDDTGCIVIVWDWSNIEFKYPQQGRFVVCQAFAQRVVLLQTLIVLVSIGFEAGVSGAVGVRVWTRAVRVV